MKTSKFSDSQIMGILKQGESAHAEAAGSLAALSYRWRSWGFGLMLLHLRNVQGKCWNHKRAYGVYCEL